MKNAIRTHVAAALLLLPAAGVLVAAPAAAQSARVAPAAPSVSSLSLDSDHGLAPGATLRVQVQATPGARNAFARLGSSGVTVALQEKAPGRYVGSHVVRHGERLDASQLITAQAAYRDRTVASNFNYPAAFRTAAMGNAPAVFIERLAMRPVERLEPGRELRFRVTGAPRADGRLDIPGVVTGIALDEVRPGVYEGSYVIRHRDNPEAFRHAVATLREGRHQVSARIAVEAGREFGPLHGRGGWDRDDDRRARALPLDLTSHADQALVDARGRVALQGRTAPGATVRVQVEAFAPMGPRFGVTRPVADHTVQADRNGYFAVWLEPNNHPLPGSRFEVDLTATSGRQTAHERLTLLQRQG